MFSLDNPKKFVLFKACARDAGLITGPMSQLVQVDSGGPAALTPAALCFLQRPETGQRAVGP